MNRAGWLFATGMTLMLATPRVGAAQTVRSLVPQKRDQEAEIPREHRPPAGMCRVWIDGVPPSQQPAPTDCTTAVRSKPKNGRVIFGEALPDSGGRKKEKPRKPDES